MTNRADEKTAAGNMGKLNENKKPRLSAKAKGLTS